jgi:dipeptidyl-peptidase-4
MHLYLYSRANGSVRQLTQGDWLIDTTPYGILTAGRPVYVDPAGTWAYVNATKQSPLERQIYRVDVGTGELQQLSDDPGFHAPALSGDGRYLVDQSSATDTPPVTSILDAAGGLVAQLAACAGPSLDLPAVQRESVTIEADDGTPLSCQMVKPEGFDPAKKYPVVVHWYGGPGLQLVSNRYGTTNIFNIIERDTLYTQAGYIVWRLDNRGAFGRGHAFEAPVYGELGPAALQDQLAGIDYLKTLPYVDATRIGTDGKSFGGFMTLYALLHAADVFRCGVAGSAPTDWSWYDTIYTERYMRTPAVNPGGYAATDLVAIADQLQAAPLIISGTADTNVHLQNSMNFIRVLEHTDKPYVFVPLVGYDHSYKGDGLVTALAASVDYFEDEL